MSSLVKKASESLNIDLLFYYLIGKTYFNYSTSVYSKIYSRSISVKEKPQRRQDIVNSALLETYHVRAAQ